MNPRPECAECAALATVNGILARIEGKLDEALTKTIPEHGGRLGRLEERTAGCPDVAKAVAALGGRSTGVRDWVIVGIMALTALAAWAGNFGD